MNNCLNQLSRNRHSVQIDSFLQSFESPRPNGPSCSSRNNSASKIKRLDELPLPDCSPIARNSDVFNGTFIRGTPRHSIDWIDRTLRRKSHSVSGHEKWFDETVSPVRQRSGSSSLNTSPRQEFNLACLAPVNTPEANSSTSSPEENSRRHSLGELQMGSNNNVQMNREGTGRRSRKVGRTDHDIPVIHHSHRKVHEWLKLNCNEKSQFPSSSARSNLKNLNVSDFDIDPLRSPAPSLAQNSNEHFEGYDDRGFYPNEYMQCVGYPPSCNYNPCHMVGHWNHLPMYHVHQAPVQHYYPMAPCFMPHPIHLEHVHANPSSLGSHDNIHDRPQHHRRGQAGTSKPPSSSNKTSRKSHKSAANGRPWKVRVSKCKWETIRYLRRKGRNLSNSSIKISTVAEV